MKDPAFLELDLYRDHLKKKKNNNNNNYYFFILSVPKLYGSGPEY